MNVGDKVKYIKDGVEYFGIILTKETTRKGLRNISNYKVSILALGIVIDSDGSDISVLA